MKKSEAVKLIADIILAHNDGSLAMNGKNYDYVIDNEDDVIEMASHILNVLIDKGLKPPVEKTCPVLFRTEHTWEADNA